MEDYPYTAKRRIVALIKTLEAATQQDPEQEVRGIALPVLDDVIVDVKAVLSEDPVVKRVEDVISPQAIGRGEPVRAIDALLVARQLDAAIGHPRRKVRWPPA